MNTEIKGIVDFLRVKSCKSGTLSAVASTARLDRDGESILPSAFVRGLTEYKRNPVILANHTHRSADGSPTIIGSATRVEVVGDALEFDMAFASTPLAKQWQSLFDEGHARAFSVGFIPKAGQHEETLDGLVYVHSEVELLEISAVGVPANPDAVRRDVDRAYVESMVDRRLDRIFAAIERGEDCDSGVARIADKLRELAGPRWQ